MQLECCALKFLSFSLDLFILPKVLEFGDYKFIPLSDHVMFCLTGQPICCRTEAGFALIGAWLDLLCVAGYMNTVHWVTLHVAPQFIRAPQPNAACYSYSEPNTNSMSSVWKFHTES